MHVVTLMTIFLKAIYLVFVIRIANQKRKLNPGAQKDKYIGLNIDLKDIRHRASVRRMTTAYADSYEARIIVRRLNVILNLKTLSC